MILLCLTKDVFEGPNYNISKLLFITFVYLRGGRGGVIVGGGACMCHGACVEVRSRIVLAFNHMGSGGGIRHV